MNRVERCRLVRRQGDERPDMGEVPVHQRFEGVEIAVLHPEDQGVFGGRIKAWPGRLHQSRPHIARGESNLTHFFGPGASSAATQAAALGIPAEFSKVRW